MRARRRSVGRSGVLRPTTPTTLREHRVPRHGRIGAALAVAATRDRRTVNRHDPVRDHPLAEREGHDVAGPEGIAWLQKYDVTGTKGWAHAFTDNAAVGAAALRKRGPKVNPELGGLSGGKSTAPARFRRRAHVRSAPLDSHEILVLKFLEERRTSVSAVRRSTSYCSIIASAIIATVREPSTSSQTLRPTPLKLWSSLVSGFMTKMTSSIWRTAFWSLRAGTSVNSNLVASR